MFKNYKKKNNNINAIINPANLNLKYDKFKVNPIYLLYILGFKTVRFFSNADNNIQAKHTIFARFYTLARVINMI